MRPPMLAKDTTLGGWESCTVWRPARLVCIDFTSCFVFEVVCPGEGKINKEGSPAAKPQGFLSDVPSEQQQICRCKITGRQITITGCGVTRRISPGRLPLQAPAADPSCSLRLMPSVEALCSRAEVVGGRMPTTPRKSGPD